jgi:hypothetical protein
MGLRPALVFRSRATQRAMVRTSRTSETVKKAEFRSARVKVSSSEMRR